MSPFRVASVRTAMLAALLGALLPPFAAGNSAAAQQAQGPANPLAAQALEGFSATRERPLFSPQRRPPAAPRMAVAPPPPPPVPPTPPQVALYGIVTEANGARAMIRANGDKIIAARIGDDIAGWKVTKIGRRQIELMLADRAVSFAMFTTSTAAARAAELEGEDDDPPEPPRNQQRR